MLAFFTASARIPYQRSARGAARKRAGVSNENTVTKSQVRKAIKSLGYHKVSIRTYQSLWGKTFAKIYVYGPYGECIVGDNVYYNHTNDAARAALDYINKLPKCFDTGEIIFKK